MAEEHHGRRHRAGQTPGPAQAISALRSLRREGLAARESDQDDEGHRHAGLSGQASRGGIAQEGSQTPRANDALTRVPDTITDSRFSQVEARDSPLDFTSSRLQEVR